MTYIEPISYKDGQLYFLDQTLLPNEEKYIRIETKEDVREAIKALKVRGAPAIGVAAAYGLAVSVRNATVNISSSDMKKYERVLKSTADYLVSARPTAVNLAWALDRMVATYEKETPTDKEKADKLLLETAETIRREDEEACFKMGEYGLSLLKPRMGLLTHCNAGTIATAKYGTCLAPIYLGHERGYDFKVFADETRPLLQGARLTTWELNKAGIDVTLICDNMANLVMTNSWVDAVLVGCDRMAANGDGANKIGTSALAVLAKEHGIPFYMFVPGSTVDLSKKSGDDIPIELREGDEIRSMWYTSPMAPEGVKTYNPSFDITPAEYITAVITEKGIVRPPYEENLKALFD